MSACIAACRLRRVATCQRNLEFLRQIQQSLQKAANPRLRNVARKGQRQECRPRLATHRRDIAQPARQAPPPHQLWTMPISPEMHLFDGEVGGHEQLVSRRNPQHRAVIADAGYHRLASAGRTADLLNQLLLAKRHVDHYTSLPNGARQSPPNAPLLEQRDQGAP